MNFFNKLNRKIENTKRNFQDITSPDSDEQKIRELVAEHGFMNDLKTIFTQKEIRYLQTQNLPEFVLNSKNMVVPSRLTLHDAFMGDVLLKRFLNQYEILKKCKGSAHLIHSLTVLTNVSRAFSLLFTIGVKNVKQWY